MKTQQEVFDFVVKALVEQGRPAWDPKQRMCMYRTPDGCKCAAGHLIPDESYKPSFERKSIDAVVLRGVVAAIGVEGHLLYRLQRAHDQAAEEAARAVIPRWLQGWAHNMRVVALTFNLSPALLDQLVPEQG